MCCTLSCCNTRIRLLDVSTHTYESMAHECTAHIWIYGTRMYCTLLQIPLEILHPWFPPNRETQIPQNKFKLDQNLIWFVPPDNEEIEWCWWMSVMSRLEWNSPDLAAVMEEFAAFPEVQIIWKYVLGDSDYIRVCLTLFCCSHGPFCGLSWCADSGVQGPYQYGQRIWGMPLGLRV